MEPTLPEVLRFTFALVFLIGLAWVFGVIGRHFQVDASPARLARMMRRLSIGSWPAGGQGLEYHIPTAARICRRCDSQAEFDAWLSQGRTDVPPEFCPNAGFLRLAAAESRRVR